jgi:hypothetical protein
MERQLERMFYNTGEFGKHSATKYATDTPREWMAENYALAKMEKMDLVDRKLLTFINTLL